MPRRSRIDKIWFYHILNRGVDRANIYHDSEDFKKFLQILQDASEDYDFEIYSFCLMSNHYHLLIKTSQENLSTTLQKINARYSMYYNHKYKRVGPLWQGRFKSWYVYDEHYLQALVKYIELNPLKANITDAIGKYIWSMSSKHVQYPMLNFELIHKTDFTSQLTKEEQKNIDNIFSSKMQTKEDDRVSFAKKEISYYFTSLISKQHSIYNALRDGYTQKELGNYLELSHVSISKMLKNYKQKLAIFKKLQDKGVFWSYSKEMTFDEAGETLTIENLLKYGDFDDIKSALELFGKRVVKKVWREKLATDKSFIKTNLLIARVFFGMEIESDYFKEMKNERFEKLRLLAS